jgi:hypothetical protein
MVIVLTPDDLVYDFKGNKRKPKLTDFPAVDTDILEPDDVMIYRYQDKGYEETLLLRGPLEVSKAVKAAPYSDALKVG